VVWRLAWPLGRQYARNRRHELQSETDFQGSRENLHLVERWTRTGPASLEYAVTIEDPTVWTRSWTVKQESPNKATKRTKRITNSLRRRNYSLPSLLLGARMEDLAFAEGRGPDPATKTTPRILWALKRIRCSDAKMQ